MASFCMPHAKDGRLCVEDARIVVRPDDEHRDDGDPEQSHVHVFALAHLTVRGTRQTVGSPGTWSVPLLDRAALNAEAREAYDELREILAALGASLDQRFESVPWDDTELLTGASV